MKTFDIPFSGLRPLAVIFISIFLAVGCSKSDDDDGSDPDPSHQKTVYLGGILNPNDPIPVVWKDDVMETLNFNGDNGVVFSVGFINGHYYAIGYEMNQQNPTAVLWKDGQPEYLPRNNPQSISAAYDSAVSGNNFFVIGVEVLGSDNWMRIWKNGEDFYTGVPLSSASEMHIAAHGNEIYICDKTNLSNNYAILNSNIFTVLTETELDLIYCIEIFGDDIYIGGSKNGRARYVKNGTPVDLSQLDSAVFSIYADGNDVYAGGGVFVQQNTSPVVWKNGQEIFVNSGGNYGVGSVIADGDDWYGIPQSPGSSFTGGPFYWKNGNLRTSSGAMFTDIVIANP